MSGHLIAESLSLAYVVGVGAGEVLGVEECGICGRLVVGGAFTCSVCASSHLFGKEGDSGGA